MTFKEFIVEHSEDDCTKLLLAKDKWPEIDMSAAVNTIQSRRKIKSKLPQWYACSDLVFPNTVSAEQCSSAQTAALKAEIALRALDGPKGAAGPDGRTPEEETSDRGTSAPDGRTPEEGTSGRARGRLADLTGGLGVDTEAFCMAGFEVLYNEMDPEIFRCARHNLPLLGLDNITYRNCRLVPEGTAAAKASGTTEHTPAAKPSGATEHTPAAKTSPGESASRILGDFAPDIIFLDPARRDSLGRKVFLLEDCSPDIVALKDELLAAAPTVIVKISPMADISMVLDRLGPACDEIHIVASHGECRELLAILRRNRKNSDTQVHIWEDRSELTLTMSEISQAGASYPKSLDEIAPGRLLFEPGKALMKSGAFDLISSRFGLTKLAKSTHFYLVPETPHPAPTDGTLPHGTPSNGTPTDRTPTNETPTDGSLTDFGKLHKIEAVLPLNNAGIKQASKTWPEAEVTARNIPMSSETLKAKLRSKGGPTHIFGLRCEAQGPFRNLLIVTGT